MPGVPVPALSVEGTTWKLWLDVCSVALASRVIIQAVDKSVLGSKSLELHCPQAISTLLWNSTIQWCQIAR